MTQPRENIWVICHQIRSPQNMGAVARAMANFGFSRLVLSDPGTYDFSGARQVGVHAEHVVDGMAVARDLPEALSKVVYACASTSRNELRRQQPLTPGEAARKLVEASRRGPVALVLGGEQRGLSDDELSHCTDVVVIPTGEVQPSMNLSHAAAVLLYEVSEALAEVPVAPPAPEPGARLGTVQALEKRMRQVLLEAGFLNPQAPDYIVRDMARSVAKAGFTQKEAELWLSAFAHLERWGRRP